MDATKLVAWLRFDESATLDRCGGTWTTIGSPTIENGALKLDGSSCLKLSGSLSLGGQDFTVNFYENKSGGGQTGATFCIYADENHFMTLNNEGWYINYQRTNSMPSGTNHIEFVYAHSEQKVYFFLNGVLINSRVTNIFSARQNFNVTIGWGEWRTGGGTRAYWGGTIDEFQIYDGVALHTANFTPPTAADYEDLAFQLDGGTVFIVDVERRISNVVEFTADVERKLIAAWRYFNAGTADTLTVTGTTLTDLPETKSITGTAFYQTAREKCFDLPSTPEIWIKFDVYFDGSNRWRAYNGGANGSTGITAQTSGELSFFSNGTNGGDFAGICKANQLQTVLLHMISGTSAGVIEAWVDGTKIYTYTGDVNHGEDFADIYLQSDGTGTFFSNVVIANKRMTFADGYQKFTADVERRTTKRIEFTVDVEREVRNGIAVDFVADVEILDVIPVEFTADVQRGIMEVINVPFIFGDHFNHCCSVEYDAPTTSIGRPLKIKLPNKSKAYVHATALNGGAFKVFSDTDAVGTVTGDVYAALDECESVFVQKVVAPQSILYMFLNSLRYRGGSALDSAIENCTYGVFPSKDELVNSFLNDLDNSESNLDFLSRCCGVDLSNDDTGAVIGSDAGGGYPKTAKSIVPEPVPVEDWIVPEKGSSKTIAGLTVYFPTSGYKGTLTDAENHILAGLNSVWIEQALLLIQRSCNIDFRTNQTNIVHDISVKFVDENNDALAYVSITTKDGSTTSLELRVNMRRYSGINMTSEDGAAGSNTYLDRVLAHEMTHAVMAARIKNYTELPRFLREGIAEFIHGIDDERKSDIQYLTQTAQRNTLQSIFSTGGDSGDINIYSAGYLFFRYMIKQTLEKGNFPLERYSSTGHIRLFISDGAVDYFGNALTDNTRAIFSADVQRELVRTTSFNADVAIFDTIQIEFDSDINRAIKGKVKLFAIDTSEYFSGGSDSGTLNPVVIPPQETIPAAPDNTIGLQSIEISLSEQQLTDNVSFVGVVPFDIMFPVQGQYLDYVFDMRVERFQQKGVLYTCDCRSNIDELLYTQISYSIAADYKHVNVDLKKKTITVTTMEIDKDEDVEEIKAAYASTHLKEITRRMGLRLFTSFKDFVSDIGIEQKNVTYEDLITSLFGWTSRLPHRMINCFIRNGALFVIERGHEPWLIDLTHTKHTIPTIDKSLVRTAWGSSPELKTYTLEHFHPGWDLYPPPPSVSEDGKTHYSYMRVHPHGYCLIRTSTENDDGSRHVVGYHYSYGSYGEPILTSEESIDYDENGEVVSKKKTVHHSLTPSQQFSRVDDEDGVALGSNVGSNLPGFYNKKIQLRPEQIISEERPIHGTPLIDTSFPVVEEETLKELTEEINWLNRRTKETVTMTIYNFPHLIDFNDRILFNGAIYFLVSNTATTTPRIFNEQHITFTRWY